VPLLLASGIYAIMLIWHRGSAALNQQLHDSVVPVDAFFASLAAQNIPRVPGAGVFLTRTINDVPPVMLWHVKHNEALHQRLLVLTVTTLSKPWVNPGDRLSMVELAPDFWRATAQYGFMERPDIPRLLELVRAGGCALPMDRLTFYVGRETVVSREDGGGHPQWETAIFAAMARNASHVSDFLRLPDDCLVEIGRQVAI